MTDWVTVAISGGSVCLGAGLTMLGQYLGDRRSHIRDREARREGFKISNYEIQREALLELQEHVLKLSIFVRDATALGIAADLRPDDAGHEAYAKPRWVRLFWGEVTRGCFGLLLP